MDSILEHLMKMISGTYQVGVLSVRTLLLRGTARFFSPTRRRAGMNVSFRTTSSLQTACQRPDEVRVSRLPLVERLGNHVSSSAELLEWRRWARSHAALTKLEASGVADLPSLASLYTEIDWLVVDVIAATRPKKQGQRQLAWIYMASLQVRDIPPAHEVLLRESLAELRLSWLKRLRDRVPLQYITSTCFWRDLTLFVSPAVLIPRPETELMVEHVKTVLDRCPSLCCGPWVDLGTGSGALAISIAAEVLRMRASSALENGCMDGKPVVHAVDLSLSSVQIARCNASRHFSLTERGKDAVQIHQGSWFEPLESLDIVHRHAGTLAGIVSNPPYISSDEMLDLQPEVRYHEPWLALESGRNGVEALELICEGASRYLLPGGVLLLETGGGGQTAHIDRLLRSFKEAKNGGMVPLFENIQIHADHHGVRRFITARKSILF